MDRHLLWQRSVPYSRYQKLAQSCSTSVGIKPHTNSTSPSSLGQAFKQRSHWGCCVRDEGACRQYTHPGPLTGLYKADEEEDLGGWEKGKKGLMQFSLPLLTAKEMAWEAQHNPVIRFPCVFTIISLRSLYIRILKPDKAK